MVTDCEHEYVNHGFGVILNLNAGIIFLFLAGEIRLSIYFLQNNATMESNDSGDLLLHPRMTELPSRSSTSPSNSSSPVREEITSAKDEKSSTHIFKS